MFERSIVWQHAIKFGEIAHKCGYVAEKIKPLPTTNATLLPLTSDMAVKSIRDWIFDTVGPSYALSAIWGDRDSRRTAQFLKEKDWFAGGNITELHLPCAIRFSFADIETAVLFKLTWFNP